MGGNLFKEYDIQRMSSEDYFNIWDNVKYSLTSDNIKFDLIPTYYNKQDFGDMDIIIDNNIDIKQLLINVLSPPEIHSNGGCYSIPYYYWKTQSYHQIDFIGISPTYYYSALNYHAYGDCGNLIGRISKKLGFKFGHEGLSYIIRDGNYVIKEINVSTDFHKILRFLKFDDSNYGYFHEMYDIFDWIASNPYFNKEIYLLENLNHISRTRDKKRKFYNLFLEYCNENDFENNYDYTHIDRLRTEYLYRAFGAFENFEFAYNKALKEYEEKLRLKEVFNGDIVSKITGLKGKDLGQFMNYFRGKYDISKYDNLESLIYLEFTIFYKVQLAE